MSDLVERLRAQVPYQGKSNIAFLCHEAADALAAKDAEIVGLREARDFYAGRYAERCGDVVWLKALLEEAGKVGKEIVEQCEAVERELTEEHYHMHYSGESLPICKARAFLAKLEADNAD